MYHSEKLDPARYVKTLENGETAAKRGEEITLADLTALGTPKSPIRAIRAFCRECSGGSAYEANKCTAFRCPLWPMREGRNPFHGKFVDEGDSDDRQA